MTSEPLILADIATQFQSACTGTFASKCADLDNVIAQIKDGMRDRLIADDRIVQISETAEPDPRDLVASDGASFDQNYLPISVGLSLAAMGNSDNGFSWKERALALPAIQEASQFSLAARHADELALLETLPDDQIGILDGSFWTELTKANQLVYAVSADDGGLRGDLPCDLYGRTLGEYVKEITRSDSGKSMLRRVLSKTNVIGISKRGVTNAFCKDERYSDLFTVNQTTLHLPDKAVMTYALEPGEYLRPTPLAAGNFGCHTDKDFGFSKADKVWFRNHFKNGIHQTFWKPHAAQPAYRVEYNRHGFNEIEIESLLASIQSATTVLRVVEPLPQYMADYVAKNVSQAGGLFEKFITAKTF